MEDYKAELERLRTENATLKKARAITMKVASKGGLSVYGLGRWPVTLYREQWVKLLDMAPEIRQFMADNADKFKLREPPP